jgi:hypothetical protein
VAYLSNYTKVACIDRIKHLNSLRTLDGRQVLETGTLRVSIGYNSKESEREAEDIVAWNVTP